MNKLYEDLEVHYIDVGQADSILLINSDQAMLIDAGDTNADDIIIPYIKKLGIEKLEAVVFTHPHKDHIGSGYSVIETFDIGKIYMSGKTTNTKTFENLLDSIEAKNAELIIPRVSDKIEFGNCDITVLGPVEEYDEINDNSIVLKVKYKDTDFLFTGDMEERAEKDLINSSVNLNSDVLKVAHHGSNTSSSHAFLREVNPKYAVISCGEDNDYNHPHENIISRLNEEDSEIFRTDKMGTIVAVSNGKNIKFNIKDEAVHTNENEKNSDEASSTTYIGNINSKKFHSENCNSLPDEKNRIYFKSREKAAADGYKPCGLCKP